MQENQRSVAEQAQACFDGITPTVNGDAEQAPAQSIRDAEQVAEMPRLGPSWWTRRLTLSEWVARHGLWTLGCVATAIVVGALVSPTHERPTAVVASVPSSIEPRASLYAKLEANLHDERARADAAATEQRAQLGALRQADPNLNIETAQRMLADRLTELGKQLTAAQAATVQAERTYGKGHAMRQRALDCEIQISNALNDAQSQAQALNSRANEIANAQRELERREAVLARLDARIDAVTRRRDVETMNALPIPKPQAAVPYASTRAPSSRVTSFALIGAAIGLLWSLVRERMDERLRNVDEVRDELGAAVVGVVPAIPSRRAEVGRAMIAHLDPRGRAADAFRSVRTRLLLGGRHTGRPLRTIVVTSAEPGEGRTLCAVNLAVTLAKAGRSVLLVDADLRNPSLARLLDLRDGSGLTDVLQSPRSLRWAVQPGGIEGLDVLPSGAREGEQAPPGALIDRFQIQAILAAPTGKYDHIIFDAPAVNDVADATVLASECDATLLVIRADRTTRRSAHAALDALTVVGAKVAGVIVNLAPAGRRFELERKRSLAAKPDDASVSAGATTSEADNVETPVNGEPASA